MTKVQRAEIRRRIYLSETGRIEPQWHPGRRNTHGVTRSVIAQRNINRRIALSKMTPAELADGDGYAAGFHDRHTTGVNFTTGEEWIAWYRGWKRGQAERPKDIL